MKFSLPRAKIMVLCGFLGYAIILLVVFGKALIPEKNQIIFGPDIWRYHYYQKLFLADSLKHGIVPWWNPFTFSGVPYIEHPQSIPWYLGNIIFIIFPKNMAFSWYFAIHMFIAMVGMYRLSCIWAGRFPSWIAGIVFGISGFFFARIYAGHIDIIAETSWMPWVIAYGWLAMDRQNIRSGIIAGVFLALEIFAGYITFAIFTAIALGVAAVCIAIGKRSLKSFYFLTLATIVGVGIGAIQILPNYQFINHSIRTLPQPSSWSSLGTPIAANMLELIDPFFFYNKLPIEGLGHEHSAYLGKVPLVILLGTILWVINKRKKEIHLWFFILLTVLAWWIALGQNASINLFALLQKWVPFYRQIRIPPRQLVWFVLASATLIGIGLNQIRNKKILIVVAALTIADLVPIARGNVHLGPLPEAGFDQTLVTTFTQSGELFRTLPDFFHGDLTRDNYEFNTPMLYQTYSISGYDSPPLRNYWEFLMAVNNLAYKDLGIYTETIPPFQNIDSVFTDFLNVKYVWVPSNADPQGGRSTGHLKLLVDKTDRGYRLYENVNVYPRFFLVPNLTVIPNRADIVTMISTGKVDPRQTVLSQKGNTTSCPSVNGGTVTLLSYTNSSIELSVTSPCDAVLATSEVMYPGWSATIDGMKTDIFEGNLAFRTLMVPQGTHQVILFYRPLIVLYGALLTFLTISGSIVLWIYAKRR